MLLVPVEKAPKVFLVVAFVSVWLSDEFISAVLCGVCVGVVKLSSQVSLPVESIPSQTCALFNSGCQYQPPYCFTDVGCTSFDKGLSVGIGVAVGLGEGVGLR